MPSPFCTLRTLLRQWAAVRAERAACVSTFRAGAAARATVSGRRDRQPAARHRRTWQLRWCEQHDRTSTRPPSTGKARGTPAQSERHASQLFAPAPPRRPRSADDRTVGQRPVIVARGSCVGANNTTERQPARQARAMPVARRRFTHPTGATDSRGLTAPGAVAGVALARPVFGRRAG